MTVWRYTRGDAEFSTGDRLLAAGLPLLLATSNQAEAGWRSSGRNQHLGGPGWGSFRPVGHGWRRNGPDGSHWDEVPREPFAK